MPTTKISYAATKIRCNQINKQIFFKKVIWHASFLQTSGVNSSPKKKMPSPWGMGRSFHVLATLSHVACLSSTLTLAFSSHSRRWLL